MNDQYSGKETPTPDTRDAAGAGQSGALPTNDPTAPAGQRGSLGSTPPGPPPPPGSMAAAWPPPPPPPPGSMAADGPPTTQWPPGGGGPVGPPPFGMPPHQPAPEKKRGKTPLLVAGAMVLALGVGAAGGLVGYSLADAGSEAGSSSPSEMVGDGATISDIAEAVQPSVVSIATENAGGSGVVYDDEGHIITNNHVAETAGGGKLEVAFPDGSTSKASVVGTDPAGDLAVLKVDDTANLKPIDFGDSGGLDVGDTVLALGSPLGLDGSVTSGIVSALDRKVQAGGQQGGETTTLNGLIQTDASINPGNSGGALVNGKGQLIGINTVIATAGGSEGSVGLGFAIPSDTVESTVDQIIKGGGVEHAFMGVSVTDNVSDDKGAVVSEVQDGSPAKKAGLKKGDVITKIGGDDIKGASDLVSVVQGAEPGKKMDVVFIRDGDEKKESITLGSKTN